MNSYKTKVTLRGRVTIPKLIRNKLNIRGGDQIGFEIDSANRVSIVRNGNPASSAGILRHLAKKNPLPVKQLSR